MQAVEVPGGEAVWSPDFPVHQLDRVVDMFKAHDVSELVQDDGGGVVMAVGPLQFDADLRRVELEASGDEALGPALVAEMRAAAGADDLPLEFGSSLGRGPADEQRRPPLAVSPGLVRVALLGRLLTGRAIVDETDACRPRHRPDGVVDEARRACRGQFGIHHVVQRPAR